MMLRLLPLPLPPPAPAVTLGEHSEKFSEPTRYRVAPGVVAALVSWGAFGVDPGALISSETTSAARFVPPFSQPTQFSRALPAHAQQFSAFVKADPFGEDVPSGRFVRPFSEPVRYARALPVHAQQFAAFVKAAPFGETVTAAAFVPPFSQPTQFPRALPSWAQRFDALVKATPFPETVSADRFVPPFSQPTQFPRRLPVAYHKFNAQADSPIPFIAGAFTLVCTATFDVNPSTRVSNVLGNRNTKFLYTVELAPWQLSDRSS